MKYLVYRHDNAFGNTAELVVNLANILRENRTSASEIVCEFNWQKDLILLIPGVNEQCVVIEPRLDEYYADGWRGLNAKYPDILIPSYYATAFHGEVFEAGWEYLPELKFRSTPLLQIPNDYVPQASIKFDVVIQFRERGTWDRRVDGRFSEPQRDVNYKRFHRVVTKLSRLGYSVARIGDEKQKKLPGHARIRDFKDCGLNLRNDVNLINNSILFVSTDSSIWPIAAGLGKEMLLTNVASIYEPFRTHKKLLNRVYLGPRKIFIDEIEILPINEKIVSWLDPKKHFVLSKHLVLFGLFKFKLLLIRDNSYSEILGLCLNRLGLNKKT